MAPLAERSLEDAVDRFEAACDGRIIYIGLPWKAFEDFLAALNDYWESIKGRSLPESVEYEISKMFEIRRRLLSQPLNPSNQESGIADLALGEATWPGVIQKILTTPVEGLENYKVMMRLLVEDKEALKVYVNVAEG